MKNVKLFGLVATTAVLAACTGNLPTGTGTAGQPGFTVRVTKAGTGVSDRTVFLKKFNAVSAGSFSGGAAVGTSAKTDSNGVAFLPVPADAATSGGLFGVAYDKGNTSYGGDAKNVSAQNNPDEIQWFTTPAMDLSQNKSQSVNIELSWDTRGFQPANGAAVAGPNVTFTLPTRSDATQYEVVVLKGSVAGSGSKADNADSLKGSSNSITWSGAPAGDYNYTGKFFTAQGMGQGSSSALTFKVSNQ